MQRKTFILLVMSAIIGMMVIAGLAVAVDVPDQISIYDDTFTDHKKGPVEFHHKKHSTDYGIACADCHHKYEGGKNIWKEGDPVQPCRECHKLEKEGDVDKLQNAFHKNCKDCHKEKDKGPYKKCNDCHGEKK